MDGGVWSEGVRNYGMGMMMVKMMEMMVVSDSTKANHKASTKHTSFSRAEKKRSSAAAFCSVPPAWNVHDDGR